MVPQGQSWGFGGGMVHHMLNHQHPVEREAIFAEIRDGVYMDPETFRRRRAGATRNRARREAALHEEEARHERAERDFWDRIKRGEWPGEWV